MSGLTEDMRLCAAAAGVLRRRAGVLLERATSLTSRIEAHGRHVDVASPESATSAATARLFAALADDVAAICPSRAST